MTLTLTKKDKLLLIGLGIVIVILLYFQLIVSPSLKSISKVKDTIKNNAYKLSELENKKVQNTILKKNIKKLETQYYDKEGTITEGTKDNEISTSILSLADKNKVKLTSINYAQGSNYTNSNNSSNNNNNSNSNNNNNSNNTNASGSLNALTGQIMKMQVTIAVNGNINDVNSFVADLEHMDRLNVTSNVSINKTDNAYNAVISTDYYYFYSEKNQ